MLPEAPSSAEFPAGSGMGGSSSPGANNTLAAMMAPASLLRAAISPAATSAHLIRHALRKAAWGRKVDSRSPKKLKQSTICCLMVLGLRRTRRVGFAARLKYGSSSARMMWVCAALLGFASVRCAVWVLLTSKVLCAVLLEHARE